MYCTECGSRNPDFGKYCHNCGTPLVRTALNILPVTPQRPSGQPPISIGQKVLIQILQIDPKANECHKCGSDVDLSHHQFGIAKVLSTRRDWSGTIGTAAASAVSIALAPVIGGAVVGWQRPGKTVSFNVIRAELVLCSNCLYAARNFREKTKLEESAYRCHPWAERARSFGYQVYLSAEELAKLKPMH